MTSAKQIAANRANAAKSTGPRSESGKARVSLNALSQGVRAQSVVLPCEDEQDLHTLREALHQELLPQGPLQEEWFEVVVDCFWRLRRCRRAECGALWGRILMRHQLKALSDSDGSRPEAPHGADPDTLDLGLAYEAAADALGKLDRYETSIIRRIERACRELKRLQNEGRGDRNERDNVIDLAQETREAETPRWQ